MSQTSKQDLLKAFRKIDVNGDGFITHDELFKVLTKVRSKLCVFCDVYIEKTVLSIWSVLFVGKSDYLDG